jgi:hypothetical protein
MIPVEYSYPIELTYPSYIDSNHYGLCLKAAADLPKGTLVAAPDFEETDKEYIAEHDSIDHRHIVLLHVSPEGAPIWARVRGKWAYCNHSCDPNCSLAPNWEIITDRNVRQGEELTMAYDAFIPNFPWPESWNFVCLCGAENCKKIINEYRMDIVSSAMRLLHRRCLLHFQSGT